MNLHDIPKEITHPLISEEWEKAAGAFQIEYNNFHPIVMTVRNGRVIHLGYRNGNYGGRLLHLGLSGGLSGSVIGGWSNRANNTLDWNLVEILTDEQVEAEIGRRN